MKRSGLAFSTNWLALAALVLAACGGSKGGGGDDGSVGPKDLAGFVSTNCASDKDCSSDACSVATCNAATHMCTTTPKDCTTAFGCTVTSGTCATAMCDASTGSAVWTAVPMGEGMTCTTDNGAAGLCTSGECAPIPSCYDPNNFITPLTCAADNTATTSSSTDPNDFDGGAAMVSSYACAPNEAGPELGFQFQLPSGFTTPVSVTLSLKLAIEDDNFNLVVAPDQTAVDLDLIVLEDSCSQTATCANPASGTGFQGVTANTSAETVTFMADPAKSYFIVVDGKDANQVGHFFVEAKACGQCGITSTNDLACNSSFPVNSTTLNGQNVLTNYTCGGSTLSYPGAEAPFLITDDSGVARKITASLVGATAGTGLLVLDQATDGDCQGTDCIGSSIVAADGTASVSWSTNPTDAAFSGAPVFSRNWVVVDSPNTTTTTFGLSVACAPYCAFDQNFNSLYCNDSSNFSNKQTSGATTVGAPSQVTQWGSGAACGGLTGLTGPEDVITFAASVSGHATTYTYTVELVSKDSNKTQNLSLIILDAGATASPACDPTAACANFTALSASTANPNASGSLTTDVANKKVVDVSLTAEDSHSYLFVVDGKGAAGADFTITVLGPDTFAGCQ